MVQNPRSENYRYSIVEDFSSITPLAHIEVHWGPKKIHPLNISQGGIALLLENGEAFTSGDIIDLSIMIRDRSFPVKIEVKNMRSLRASCEFIEPNRNFISALREFLKPKFLAATLSLRDDLSKNEELKSWVPESNNVLAYVGQNQTAVFVWMGIERDLLKIFAVAADLVFEWQSKHGLRTGRLMDEHVAVNSSPESKSPPEGGHGIGNLMGTQFEKGVRWDKHSEQAVLHYFADIFLTWLNNNEAADFVERLTNDRADDDVGLKFPKPT